MRIFDAHYHLDKGEENYNIEADRRNYIFNYIEQYRLHSSNIDQKHPRSLLFDFSDEFNFVKQEVKSGRIQGLKIHSRLQKLHDEDYEKLFDAYSEVSDHKLPTILDAFYFGDDLSVQPNLNRIAQMVKLFPDNTFIIAHSGGIRVLEYFLHLKNLPNVVFELSLSLSYLKYASVHRDFSVLLRFGDRNRIIFGTDFPYVDAGDQLNVFLYLAHELGIREADMDKILFANAERVFGLV